MSQLIMCKGGLCKEGWCQVGPCRGGAVPDSAVPDESVQGRAVQGRFVSGRAVEWGKRCHLGGRRLDRSKEGLQLDVWCRVGPRKGREICTWAEPA
mgnify:CR=1 FL=1